MLSLDEFRKFFSEENLTDQQIEELYKAIHAVCENVVDHYLQEIYE